MVVRFGKSLRDGTLLCTDGNPVYNAFTTDAGITHKAVNL